MKKAKLLALLLFFMLKSYSQFKPVFQRIADRKNSGNTFITEDIFTVNSKTVQKSKSLNHLVSGQTVLELQKTLLAALIDKAPQQITLIIPVSTGKPMLLELVQVNIFTPDFTVHTGSGQMTAVRPGGLHYQGAIANDPNSIAAFSFFNDEVMGLISNEDGNFVLGKIDNDADKHHIIYNDRKLNTTPVMQCQMPDDDVLPYAEQQLRPPESFTAVSCIRIFWELNYNIYQAKGSVTAAINYATALFNQSALLFTNDNIPVVLSELFVWDVFSPYTAFTTSGLLTQFQVYRNSFNADIGHLLGLSGSGGIAAGFAGLCASNTDHSQAYSSIATSFQNIPVYSWSVEVVTHEQGHLMGSRHTHACVWNGNGTAIDGCGPSAGYNYEGNCSGAPIPAGGGTIMSYCHLLGTGINFNNGFGPQPAALIINNYINATCLTTCNSSVCPYPSGLSALNFTPSSVTLTWNAVPGAASYTIQHRISGTSTWLTGTTPFNIYNLTGLSSATTYEWNVQTVCSSGTSTVSVIKSFTTAPTVCLSPSGLTATNITATTAAVTWNAVAGASGYQVHYKLSGGSTWYDVIAINNSILLTGLAPASTYEWNVQTNCIGGDSSLLSSMSTFTTAAFGQPVTLVFQPDAECGKDALIADCVPCGFETMNFGNTSEFNAIAGTSSGEVNNNRSLIQFDLTAIPSGSYVQSAYLSLYFNPASANGQHSSLSGSNEARLLQIIAPWKETEVTWMNQPATTTVDYISIPQSSSPTQDYINIDVTALIRKSVNEPDQNFGMMLQLVSEIAWRSLIFASSDHADPGLHPKLEVTYMPTQVKCAEFKYASCNGIDALIANCTQCGYDNMNFGQAEEISCIAWTNWNNNSDARSLLYWDLSVIPSNAIVNYAGLSLYTFDSPSNGQHSTLSGPNNAWLRRVTSPWSEDAVTWNTMPSFNFVHEVALPSSTSVTEDYLNLNVTLLIQDIVADPANNFGLILQLDNENDFRKLIFASSDHVQNELHPRLDICYTIPANTEEYIYDGELSVVVDEAGEIVKFLYTKGFSGGNRLTVYNNSGQVVHEANRLAGSVYTMSRNKLASGIYMYRVSTPGKIHSGKFIFR